MARPERASATLEERPLERAVPEVAERAGAARRGKPPADPVLDFAAGWLERRVVARLLRSTEPGRLAMTRAALAGAGAELAAVAVHAALAGPNQKEKADGASALGALAAGAAEGLVYARLVRPVVPGPTWARGAAFGVARYFAARGGGLPQVLGPLSPHRRFPVFDSLVAPRGSDDDTLAEHLVAGLTLAVIYESSDLSNGTTPEGSD